MTKKYLCLPVRSAALFYPEAYCIETADLSKLKTWIDAARQQRAMRGYCHLEVEFRHGVWLDTGGKPQEIGFLERHPLDTGAKDYEDSFDLPGLNGFAIRVNNGYSVEFRCYAADTGDSVYSDSIFLRGDLLTFGGYAYNLLTGEVTEVGDEQ